MLFTKRCFNDYISVILHPIGLLLFLDFRLLFYYLPLIICEYTERVSTKECYHLHEMKQLFYFVLIFEEEYLNILISCE